jgi:hypothetical protein
MLFAIRRRLFGAGCDDDPRDNNEGGTTNLHRAADQFSHSLGVNASGITKGALSAVNGAKKTSAGKSLKKSLLVK